MAGMLLLAAFSAFIAAIPDFRPVLFPFLPPGKGQLTDGANFVWQVFFFQNNSFLYLLQYPGIGGSEYHLLDI